MTTTYEVTSRIPLDSFDAGSEAWVKTNKGSGRKVWQFRNGSVSIYLLSDPFEAPEQDWYAFRAWEASDGIIGSEERMPSWLRLFPALDTGITPDGHRVPLPNSDWVRDVIKPHIITKDGKRMFLNCNDSGRVQSKDVLVFNAVFAGGWDDQEQYRPAEGQVFLMQMSGYFGRKFRDELRKELKTHQKYVPDFNLKGKLVDISVTGAGFNKTWEVSVRTDAPPPDAVDLIDAPAYYATIREEAEEAIRAILSTAGAGQALTVKAEEDALVDNLITEVSGETTPPKTVEPIGDEPTEPAAPVSWDGVADAHLRSRLREAGVLVPVRLGREKMLALAAENNVTP